MPWTTVLQVSCGVYLRGQRARNSLPDDCPAECIFEDSARGTVCPERCPASVLGNMAEDEDKTDQDGAKMEPRWSQDGANTLQDGAKMEPR